MRNESVAPTDSRRRPDQRLMEKGHWDEANRVKNEIEDKQRLARRKLEAEADKAMQAGIPFPEYKARWFEKSQDELTGSLIHLIKDAEYWKHKQNGDWKDCPDIF
uniref:Uncharacterized protein n=1 Tax=Ditylenchus dipsaci TaxID=166011 RepID=A0A915D5G0_9BILA